MGRPRNAVVMLLVMGGLISACSFTLNYKPPFLPISFSIDSNGEVSVNAESAALTTLIGDFSVEAGASKDLTPDSGAMLVVLRHIRGEASMDRAYEIDTDELEVETGAQLSVKADGLVEISVSEKGVFVDASAAGPTSIIIGPPTDAAPPQPARDRLQAFVDALHAADGRNDLAYLLDRLDKAAFEYQTRDQCRQALSNSPGNNGLAAQVTDLRGPDRFPFFFTRPGTNRRQEVGIPNSFDVTIQSGDHIVIGQDRGRLTWVADCLLIAGTS